MAKEKMLDLRSRFPKNWIKKVKAKNVKVKTPKGIAEKKSSRSPAKKEMNIAKAPGKKKFTRKTKIKRRACLKKKTPAEGKKTCSKITTANKAIANKKYNKLFFIENF